MKLKKISSNSLQEIIGVEASLQQREKDGPIEEMFPPGHPVRVAYERSKEQWENRNKFEQQQQNVRPLKHVKHINTNKKQKSLKEVVNEIDNDKLDEARKVAREINAQLGNAITLIQSVDSHIDKMLIKFEDFPTMRLKLIRTQRMLMAMRRGLDESKLNIHRMR